MIREELLERIGQGYAKEILGEEVFKERVFSYPSGQWRLGSLEEAKEKYSKRVEEIQNLYNTVEGDEAKEREFNKKYAGELRLLNEELEYIDQEINKIESVNSEKVAKLFELRDEYYNYVKDNRLEEILYLKDRIEDIYIENEQIWLQDILLANINDVGNVTDISNENWKVIKIDRFKEGSLVIKWNPIERYKCSKVGEKFKGYIFLRNSEEIK